ncbi:MAG: DNA-3-methyladenine glycosylase I [Actinobacteria bacterium]|nr:DNA-3-methyladenine glycosylase I [Actinomycetota bacterium]
MHTRIHPDGIERCSWVSDDAIYIEYHDQEWGQRATDQRSLFEAISLEGFQAGLSWLTILKRRDAFRAAFDNFEIELVAAYDAARVVSLLENSNIIRNRAKIESVVHNARLVQHLELDLKEELWQFAPQNRLSEIANFSWKATSSESDALSKHLRKLGFKFVGSTTMYALMQSTGMIHDHAPNCFRRLRKDS